MDSIVKKNILGQIITIFFVQASSTIGYAIFYSGLSIYLTQNKHYSHQASAVVTGLFLSLNYFLPLIGGFMADRTITYKNLYYLGTLSSLAGCLLLISNHFLHLAFALFLIGSLSNVCLKMFVTQLFTREQNNERRAAFTWNYVGMNVGFMIGYFLTGFSTLSNNYHYLFILMACAKVISLIITFLFIHENKPGQVEVTFQTITANAATIFILVLIINFLFDYAEYIRSWLVIASLVALAGVMSFSFNGSGREEKQKLLQFITFSTMSILFWSVYFLTPIAIMQLINQYVQKTVFGIIIAPQWFGNINSMAILIISPVLSILFKKNNRQNNRNYLNQTGLYFSVSFFFAFVGFAILWVGLTCFSDSGKIPALFIVSYLLALTIGEILIYPATSALVGELIKEPLRGIMTGLDSITLALGGLIASIIASNFILPNVDGSNRLSGQIDVQNIQVENTFLILSIILFVAAVVNLYITTKHTKLYVRLPST
jgi:POT family proton-dependent oligopeptide transporter